MKKTIIFLTVFFLGMNFGIAQMHITGQVVDEKGESVTGATIQVKTKKNLGGITDVNGRFSISVPANSILIISYMGYKTQEVKATQKLKIVLLPANNVLQEVVITGMTVTDKRLFTGASDKLSGADIKLAGVADVSRVLEGRSAGVSVQNVSGTFGTAPRIRVRGATSIYGSSKPLWVVDGVIMEDVAEVDSDALSSGDAITLISSAIAGLNADDIESFQILKDGSATSIYGARAMSGVIVITTKKGKSGTNKISYTGEFNVRLRPSYRNFNIMDSQEQMGVYQEMQRKGYLNLSETLRASESGVYGHMYQLINTYDPEKGFGLANTEEARNNYLSKAEMRNTDWFEQLFNNNITQNHAISLSTGTEKASYYTSLSIMQDPGWTKQSSVKRYTANLNALYNIRKNLSVNLISNSSYRKQKAPGTLSSQVDPVFGEVRRDFDINPYSYAINTSRTLDPNTFYTRNYAPFNIIHELENNYIDLNVIDFKIQGELKWKIFRNVEITTLAAYKYSSTGQTHYIKDRSNQAMAFRAMDDATIRDRNPWLYKDPDQTNAWPMSVLPQGGFYRKTTYSMNSYDFRTTATYNNVYDDIHILNLFSGMEINVLNRRRDWFNGIGMQYDMGMLAAYDYLFFKQGNEENSDYFTVGDTKVRQAAFFGMATYSYAGKYTLNGTIRYEGSNKLGKSRSARWLPTWNISGAWNAHEEFFFKSFQPAVSNLTVKASYSLTADRGPASVSNSQLIIKSFNPWRPSAGDKESGLRIVELENSELTYEKKHELNIGLEIGFIRNRINISFDWYKRNNFDLIGILNTMGAGGQILKFANIASMRSHGEEFSVSTQNIKTKDFAWNTDLIFSRTKNTVTSLDSQERVIDMISGNGFTMESYPVRSLFSMEFKGLNDEGLPTFVNENGQVTVSDIDFQERKNKEHLIYEGSMDPTMIGSIGNIFKYKNFRMNIFVTYSFGNKIRLEPVFSNIYSDLTAMPREFKNRWMIPGEEKITNIPVIANRRQNQKDRYLRYAYNAYNYSSARVADGGFVRMKEISLAYDFDKKITKRLGLSDLSLKIQGTNLFLLYADSKLNGQDPEFFNTGGVAIPIPKQITLTLKLGL